MRERNASLSVPAGRPNALTPEMVPLAAEIAAECPTFTAIARGLGVHRETIRNWMRKGEQGDPGSTHAQFFAAINEGLLKGEKHLFSKLYNGDSKDAAWILTHSPFFRDDWSDAAAERRTERKTVATVVDAIAAAGLAPDDERRVLLQIQARGLGTPADEPGAEGEQS